MPDPVHAVVLGSAEGEGSDSGTTEAGVRPPPDSLYLRDPGLGQEFLRSVTGGDAGVADGPRRHPGTVRHQHEDSRRQ